MELKTVDINKQYKQCNNADKRLRFSDTSLLASICSLRSVCLLVLLLPCSTSRLASPTHKVQTPNSTSCWAATHARSTLLSWSSSIGQASTARKQPKQKRTLLITAICLPSPRGLRDLDTLRELKRGARSRWKRQAEPGGFHMQIQ